MEDAFQLPRHQDLQYVSQVLQGLSPCFHVLFTAFVAFSGASLRWSWPGALLVRTG